MSLFCKHDWKRVSAYFTPPANREVKGDADLVYRAVFGFTTQFYACKKCSKNKKVVHYGKLTEETKIK